MVHKIKGKDVPRKKLSLDKVGEEPFSSGNDMPMFSLRYLNMSVSIKKCDNKVFRKFVTRLHILSAMTWKDINGSGRHQYGWELIDRESLKPRNSIPDVFMDVDKFHVFRYDSDNHPFVATVKGTTIYPIFIESTFGDVYNHG